SERRLLALAALPLDHLAAGLPLAALAGLEELVLVAGTAGDLRRAWTDADQVVAALRLDDVLAALGSVGHDHVAVLRALEHVRAVVAGDRRLPAAASLHVLPDRFGLAGDRITGPICHGPRRQVHEHDLGVVGGRRGLPVEDELLPVGTE